MKRVRVIELNKDSIEKTWNGHDPETDTSFLAIEEPRRCIQVHITKPGIEKEKIYRLNLGYKSPPHYKQGWMTQEPLEDSPFYGVLYQTISEDKAFLCFYIDMHFDTYVTGLLPEELLISLDITDPYFLPEIQFLQEVKNIYSLEVA